MLFNSIFFVQFFLAIYFFYLVLRKRPESQNLLLLAASYYFYGFWDWRFLTLLWISTIVDYTVGLLLVSPRGESKRKLLLLVSILTNLGILGFFKYFNFFVGSACDALNALGLQANAPALRIVLPMGISFYTFQTMSYTIDIYRGKMKPTRNFLAFALYVAFFPQLVAGPIERASRLLPQFLERRRITPEKIQAGLFLLAFGFFKKVVVADNLAPISDAVFGAPNAHSGLEILIGVLAFAFQIYGDFSGYSDIARGLAKLMGFELMVNFRLPYFSTSPSEFWRRWHISLSSWLRDYLYVPLGGNRDREWKTYRNLTLTMILGGLWHGAAWTFVIWGAYHGLLLIVYRVYEEKVSRLFFRSRAPGDPPDAPDTPPPVPAPFAPRAVLRMLIMFVLVLVSWIFFRAETLRVALLIFSNLGFGIGEVTRAYASDLIFFVLPLLVLNIYQEQKGDLLAPAKLPLIPRCLLIGGLFCAILVFGWRDATEFIYFQF